MILTKSVVVNWSGRNKNHYVDLGYTFTKMNDPVEVLVSDLSSGSNVCVELLCDYCQEVIINKPYGDYLKSHATVTKDCCKKCQPKKTVESNLVQYGVEYTVYLPEVLEKRNTTNTERYGGNAPSCDPIIHAKIKQKSLDKYGYTSPSKNAELKAKTAQTNLERYGHTCSLSNPEVMDKARSTLKSKYGVTNSMQIDEVKTKARLSMYKNGTAPSSRQQRYIHNIIGGELNYPVSRVSLDIAFPEERIYVECDFSGHWLQVQLGKVTQEEMDEKEKRRHQWLSRRGWREMRIVSRSDKVPHADIVLSMMSIAREHFAKGRSWIMFMLDENCITSSEGSTPMDYGNLLWVYKNKELA